MTFIKICGITNLADALASVEAGADALGFNFYRRSQRYIEPAAAREIVEELPASVLCVGVFVNEGEPEEVARVARAAGLGGVQLHGDESPEYCRALKELYVIKALRAGAEFEPERAVEFETQAIMLDAFSATAYGGTGLTVEWSLAQRVRELTAKFFLAGGLSPENVAEAIRAVEPYAVDACSSLEAAPGRKDLERVRAFIKAVREAV